MGRLITAKVPFVGTINVSFRVEDDADDATVVGLAYLVASDTLQQQEWIYFTGDDDETGDFAEIEAHKRLLDGGGFYGLCPPEIEIDSDESFEDES